jgi:hypothetical protein
MVMEYHHHTNSLHGLHPGFLAVPVSTFSMYVTLCVLFIRHRSANHLYSFIICQHLSTVMYSVYSVAVYRNKKALIKTRESDSL